MAQKKKIETNRHGQVTISKGKLTANVMPSSLDIWLDKGFTVKGNSSPAPRETDK